MTKVWFQHCQQEGCNHYFDSLPVATISIIQYCFWICSNKYPSSSSAPSSSGLTHSLMRHWYTSFSFQTLSIFDELLVESLSLATSVSNSGLNRQSAENCVVSYSNPRIFHPSLIQFVGFNEPISAKFAQDVNNNTGFWIYGWLIQYLYAAVCGIYHHVCCWYPKN